MPVPGQVAKRLGAALVIGVTVSLVMASVTAISFSGPASASPTVGVYHYALTLDSSGSGDDFHSYPSEFKYTGSASAHWSVTFPVTFTVSGKAQTVILTPGDASAFSGTASYTRTIECAGPPCTGPPTTCSYSDVSLGPYYSPVTIYTDTPQSGGGSPHGDYVSSSMNITVVMGSQKGITAPHFHCHGGSPPTSSEVWPTTSTVPGIEDSGMSNVNSGEGPDTTNCAPVFKLPLDGLGKQQLRFSVDRSAQECGHNFDVGFVANISYIVTLNLLAPPLCPPSETDSILVEGRARLNALLAEAAQTESVAKRLDEEWASLQKTDAGYHASLNLYIQELPQWWHAESLALATKYRDKGEEPPEELPPPHWQPMHGVMLGELKELQRKLTMQHDELLAATAAYNQDAQSFNSSTQGLRDHVLAFLSWLRSLGTITCHTGAQLFEVQQLGREISSFLSGARGLQPLEMLPTSDLPPAPEPPVMVWQPVSEEEALAHLKTVNAEVSSFIHAGGDMGFVAFFLVYTDPFGVMTEVVLGATANREEDSTIENIWAALADHFTARFLKRY